MNKGFNGLNGFKGFRGFNGFNGFNGLKVPKAAMTVLFAALTLAVAAQGQHRSSPLNRGRLGRQVMQQQQQRQQQQQQQVAGDADGRQPLTTREDLKNVAKGTNGVPALAFNQTPLELVLEAYAEQVQKTILPAPDLPKATITLRSLEGQILSKEDYLFAIEHVLTMNGVVLEERGEKFLRALARKTVRQQGIPLLMDNKGFLPEKGRVVSQLITFHNIAVSEVQKVLDTFKDPSDSVLMLERTNAILVTATQENINRILEIAKAIDVATPVLEEVFVRQIKFAVANDIKTALETIVTESQKENQAKEVGPKTSGAPGFGSRTPPPVGSRLLNFNNRPGQPQPEPVKPNETMIASISDADRGMIRGKVLILADERSNKLIVITMKSNMDFFDKVIKELDVETEPEFKVEVVRLKYAEAEDVESMLNDLIGGTSSSSGKENKNQNAKTATNTKQNLTSGAKPGATPGTSGKKGNVQQGSVGDLNKDNCKVLADKRINGIVVMTRKELMPVIMRVIDDMDVRLSQVLIETVIIEITLGDDLNTGIDWVQRGRQRINTTEPILDSMGKQMYWTKKTTTSGGNTTVEYIKEAVSGGYSKTTSSTDSDGNTTTTTYESAGEGYEAVQNVVKLVRDQFFNNGGADLAGAAATGYALGGGGGSANAATLVATNLAEIAAQTLGGNSGINYILKSDKLNLSAIISASKSDTRAKYLASPIVMTVDNKEAVVEATSSRQFLTGWSAVSSSYAGSGMPSPNYSAKDIGITLKMTPKINPNGTVMLTVEEEYSQVNLKGQEMLMPSQGNTTYSPTRVDVPVSRKMTSDIRLENMQTVVLGGLTETSKDETEEGIPLLKDIPWIGKWLFAHVEQHEKRKELLVFLTPYVLDDEQSAQLEALRRKKTLSDPRPWDDHGWSASPLADPVSKKEQLRRFEDEWKKQDEERTTKLAIEKAKVDRAKKLEKMTKDEREFWINLHKDELEKEQKEAFEKQVEEQKDLKEFVETLKNPKLENAEQAIKEADKAAESENEYHKTLRQMKESGKPLPAGETLNRDAKEMEESKEKREESKEDGGADAVNGSKAVNAPKDAKASNDQSSLLGDKKDQ